MHVTLYLVALPLWASGLLLVGVPTLAAALGPLLVRRYVALERLSTNNEVAGFKFATLGVVYAVLIAFAVIIVWEKFHDAESAVTQEAGALASLYRLSEGLDPDAQVRLRAELATYIHTVIENDWPAMARGGGSSEATSALTKIYSAVLAYKPSDPSGGTVLAEVLDQLDHVTQARRHRLGLASGIVPGVVWLVLFGDAILTIGFTFFFGTENLRAQVWMSAILALAISTSLFVVVAIDYPFAGSVRVPAHALETVLEAFGEGPAPHSVAR